MGGTYTDIHLILLLLHLIKSKFWYYKQKLEIWNWYNGCVFIIGMINFMSFENNIGVSSNYVSNKYFSSPYFSLLFFSALRFDPQL